MNPQSGGPHYRLGRVHHARVALNHSVWMLAVPLLMGLASCGMAVNLQIQTALAEEAITEVLKDQLPIYLLDDKQCAAHTYQGDVVCAASWWEPAEEGGYNPAGLVQILEIADNSGSVVWIMGGYH